MDTLIVSMGEYNNTELYIGSSFLGAQQSNITGSQQCILYPQRPALPIVKNTTHSEAYPQQSILPTVKHTHSKARPIAKGITQSKHA